MGRRNIVMCDFEGLELSDFVRGLEKKTQEKWVTISCACNGARRNSINKIIRYCKYFWLPFKFFLMREKYDKIVGWQQFFGLILGFYCRLFKIKKKNFIVVKNFIYRPKKGIIGNIYYRFVRYIVESEYIDVIICDSRSNCKYCSDIFNADKGKFKFIPFGIKDFSEKFVFENESKKKAMLSLGRSNKDWNFLINALKNTAYELDIVCDELRDSGVSDNIHIHNGVWGGQSFRYIHDCLCVIIPVADGRISGGQTVLLQAMQFGKPIIVTSPSGLADDYVIDGYNGLVVEKTEESLRGCKEII